jgi:hypothetical protein
MRRLVVLSLTLIGFLMPSVASAQYGARRLSNPATGETYHVELAGSFWNPDPNMIVASESLGIVGTQIDFKTDLGIVKERFRHMRIMVRPGRKHKLRFEYTPIRYQAEATLQRDIVFNGIKYTIGLPVQSSLTWKAYRFGYEYDFVYRDRGFVGLVLEAKYTDVQVDLTSAFASEFARARAPIPAIGGIGRVYVAENASVTFELTGFKLPNSISEDYRGKYVDWDLYGTVNFNNNVGAQVGYRSLDVMYKAEHDEGNFVLRGPYFGGVVRF